MSASKYKTPFFVMLFISVILALLLVITFCNRSDTLSSYADGGNTANVQYPTMEGEITDILHGTLYFQVIELRTSDGSIFRVDVRPYTQTELIDSNGNPILVSGLVPGMWVKVTYKGFVNSPPLPESGEADPIHYPECPKIQVLS